MTKLQVLNHVAHLLCQLKHSTQVSACDECRNEVLENSMQAEYDRGHADGLVKAETPLRELLSRWLLIRTLQRADTYIGKLQRETKLAILGVEVNEDGRQASVDQVFLDEEGEAGGNREESQQAEP